MWKDWQPEVIEADLKQIAEAGLQIIRVYPIWQDFQPIYAFYGARGKLTEIRFKDGPLPKNGPGKDGISIEALDHFREFADLAHKYNLKMIVAIVTGWMSGQLLIPPALEGRDVLSDPLSMMWQIKYVRNMVHEFKEHPAILAWGLGNECNAMGSLQTAQSAYVWTASIANAIKAEDQTRPVISGMHGLSGSYDGNWRIQDQAELNDVLTTHPYPFFTPYTDQDPANTIRTIMHSAAETRFYSDLGQKPCLVEEIGIVGPMEANFIVQSAFLRSVLFNNWAHNTQGLLWWMAYDMDHVSFPPYEWFAFERELGLFRTNRSPKPQLEELKKFRAFLDQLPFENLPERKTEAVCLLTEGQDQWGAAYSTFILAKQAGFDVQFQHIRQPLRNAPLYLLPCIKGSTVMNRTEWLDILEKVKNGAVLYVSYDKGFLSHFLEPAGIEVVTSLSRTEKASFAAHDENIKPFAMNAPRKLNITSTTAKILAHENDGNPIFTENTYGKGKIFFLGLPLEMELSRTPGSFTGIFSDCWKIYHKIASGIISENRIGIKNDPFVSITEHEISPQEKIIVLVNCAPEDKNVTLSIDKGWKINKALYGTLPERSQLKMKANDACVLQVWKQ